MSYGFTVDERAADTSHTVKRGMMGVLTGFLGFADLALFIVQRPGR